MTSKRRAGSRSRRHSRRGFRLGGFLFGWLSILVVGATVAVGLYGVHLDRVVRGKFEGQRWALPARVWARPLELYAGSRLSPDQFESELKRLNYRAAEPPRNQGQYQRLGDRFQVWTRPFQFWDCLLYTSRRG